MEQSFTSQGILVQVLRQGPAYGLELVRRVRVATGRHLPVGSVYPALRALQKSGLLRAWKVIPGGRGGRSRVYYELTYAGLCRAQAEASAFVALARSGCHGLQPPSATLLRRRLDRLNDLLAFTEGRGLERGSRP